MVKAKNNPQGVRILVSEFIASGLATRIGAAAQPPSVCDLPEEIASTLVFSDGRHWDAGESFGSLLLDSAVPYLPTMLETAVNPRELIGVLAVDTWLTLHNGRQARALAAEGGGFRIIAVDFGHCFGPGNWTEASLAATVLPDRLHDPNGWSSKAARGDGQEIARQVDSIQVDEIKKMVAAIPSGWGLSNGERHALSQFVVNRKESVCVALRILDSEEAKK